MAQREAELANLFAKLRKQGVSGYSTLLWEVHVHCISIIYCFIVRLAAHAAWQPKSR